MSLFAPELCGSPYALENPNIIILTALFTLFSRHFDFQSSDTYASLISAPLAQGARVGVWADVYDQTPTLAPWASRAEMRLA